MTAVLEGSEWSAASPRPTLSPGKTRYPLGPRAGLDERKNHVPAGIRSRTVQPVVIRYTDWATRPTNFCVHSIIKLGQHQCKLMDTYEHIRAGVTNLWLACPIYHAERLPWYAAFTAIAVLFLLPDRRVWVVYNMCVCIYIYIYIYIYTHTSDCVQTVYELLLLSNNTAVKLLHKSGAVRSVDWVFIIGAPVWRWLGQ